jgi:hypothetical protein
MWGGEGGTSAYERCPDCARFTNVALEIVKNIARTDGGNFTFGKYRIEADVRKHCCETFSYWWNKTDLRSSTTKVRFRKPVPTSFSIEYSHQLFGPEDGGKYLHNMKNTLMFRFDNGDRLVFTNIMHDRIYEHCVRLYENGEQVFMMFI